MLTGDSVRQNTWLITKYLLATFKGLNIKKKSDILRKPVCVSWGTRSFLMSVVVRSAYLRTTYIWTTGSWRHVTQDLHLVVRRWTALVLLAAEAECNTLDISNHYLCSMHVLLNLSSQKETELLHLPKCEVRKIKSNWPTDHLSANISKSPYAYTAV